MGRRPARGAAARVVGRAALGYLVAVAVYAVGLDLLGEAPARMVDALGFGLLGLLAGLALQLAKEWDRAPRTPSRDRT